MKGNLFITALAFSVVSGIYWYFIGQILPIAAPLMLNDTEMLGRVLAETLVALAVYVVSAMLFLRWLLSRSRA